MQKVDLAGGRQAGGTKGFVGIPSAGATGGGVMVAQGESLKRVCRGLEGTARLRPFGPEVNLGFLTVKFQIKKCTRIDWVP
jgi:hypothetical protein